jgi:hypothetical protein
METTGTISIGSCKEYILYSNVPVDIAIFFPFSVHIFVYTICSTSGDVVIPMVIVKVAAIMMEPKALSKVDWLHPFQ